MRQTYSCILEVQCMVMSGTEENHTSQDFQFLTTVEDRSPRGFMAWWFPSTENCWIAQFSGQEIPESKEFPASKPRDTKNQRFLDALKNQQILDDIRFSMALKNLRFLTKRAPLQTTAHQESLILDCHRGFTSSRFKPWWRIVFVINN